MSDVAEPLDPFASLDLEEFKTQKKDKPAGKKAVSPKPAKKKARVQDEVIKKVAAESNFTSRKSVETREKILSKTFSLYPSDLDIVADSIRMFPISYYVSSPSSSDVIRAALHAFSELSEEKRIEMIEEHRGRGRG